MAVLKEDLTLRDLQKYVSESGKERGFGDLSVVERCLILGEEVGELFKAVRLDRGVPVDTKSRLASLSDELADILLNVCSIANVLDIDLEGAFRVKDERNNNRVWTSD